jgi:hypothetical protein
MLGTRMSAKNISVLVLPVTCDPAVQTFRQAEMRKSTAILGPHVSLLGPFAPGDMRGPTIERLAGVTRAHEAIEGTCSQLCVFADVPVLYLSVYPVSPFEALRDAILHTWPEHEPERRGPTFHLSLALGFELGQLPDLLARAHAQLDQLLPLQARLHELILADRIDGVWRTRERFPLGDR